MTDYEKFLKGDILPFKWFLCQDKFVLGGGGWDYLLYTWLISKYKNIYYISMAKYQQNFTKNADLAFAWPITIMPTCYFHFKVFILEKAPVVNSKILNTKIFGKRNERTLLKFLKNPIEYLF